MKFFTHTLRIGLLLLALGFFHEASSQNRKENIESMKIAFLTRSLSLSPEEARIFWPVYNLYQSELNEMRSLRRKSRHSVKEDPTTMTELEAEKFIDDELAFKEEEFAIQKKYHAQFKKVLSMRKVALLYRAEDDFKKELIKRLQEPKAK